jgi:hypothetical protein
VIGSGLPVDELSGDVGVAKGPAIEIAVWYQAAYGFCVFGCTPGGGRSLNAIRSPMPDLDTAFDVADLLAIETGLPLISDRERARRKDRKRRAA